MKPVSAINTIILYINRIIQSRKGNISCNPDNQEAEAGGLLGV